MSTLDTRLEEIKQRRNVMPITACIYSSSQIKELTQLLEFTDAALSDAELLLKLVDVYREALVTIECGLVTSESTAKFAGLRPKQIAHSALTKAEAIARGEE